MQLRILAWRTNVGRRQYPSLGFLPDQGPYLLTYAWNTPPRVADGDWRRRELAVGAGLIVAAFGLTLVLFLLIAWAERRESREIPLLAGFLACEQLIHVSDALVVYKDLPLIQPLANAHALAAQTGNWALALALGWRELTDLDVDSRWQIENLPLRRRQGRQAEAWGRIRPGSKDSSWRAKPDSRWRA